MKYLATLVVVFDRGIVRPGRRRRCKQARQEWLEGDYGEAREMYDTLAKDAEDAPARNARPEPGLESRGEYDKAQQVIEALLKDQPKDADLLARLGELASPARPTRRRREKRQGGPRGKQGSLPRSLGPRPGPSRSRRHGEGRRAILWFVRASNKVAITPIPTTCASSASRGWSGPAIIISSINFRRSSTITSKRRSKSDKFFWQGEYEAGRVFMDKHNKPAAFSAFEKAMTINPRAAEVLVVQGPNGGGQHGVQGRRALRRAGAEDESALCPRALC